MQLYKAYNVPLFHQDRLSFAHYNSLLAKEINDASKLASKIPLSLDTNIQFGLFVIGLYSNNFSAKWAILDQNKII